MSDDGYTFLGHIAAGGETAAGILPVPGAVGYGLYAGHPRPSCGACGRSIVGFGPCPCLPAHVAPPVPVDELDEAIRDRLDDGRDGDAVRAVLKLYEPHPVSDRTPYCDQCVGGYEGVQAWPCTTVRAIAKELGIEVADGHD